MGVADDLGRVDMADLTSAQRQRNWILAAGAIATTIGAVTAILITVGTLPDANWSAPFQLILYMLASIAISAIVGFIFGVPRVRTEGAAPPAEGDKEAIRSRFEANSNLEQISDWLTKILVGAGLVQLAALPGFLASLGEYLGAQLGPAGPAISVSVVIYGFGVGFLFSYLWARLKLRVLLEKSEVDAENESQEEKNLKGSLAAAQVAGDADSEQKIAQTAKRTAALASEASGFDAVIWVDDHPENNTTLVTAMQDLGIRVKLSRSTADAIDTLKNGQFGLVITDLERDEDGTNVPMAGQQLIKAVKELEVPPPVFVYTNGGGMRKKAQLIEDGAALVTSSPSELLERAVATVRHQIGK